jgi:hypothetical protein
MKIIEGFRLRDIMGQPTVIGEGVNQVNFNKLITLNETAAFLWKQMEGKEFDENMLTEILMEEYSIARELAEKDVKVIVKQWIELGVIE